ncbi:MAG: ACT domain-containing protein [Deltaproteobacteria bacterium]|nr:ACT domain-containing protein [Deltaproteobacteria bacterium]
MIAYQVTVPTQNTPGKLAEVSGILARERINIRAITISSFGEHGFFNILVDDPKLAKKVLNKEGIQADLAEVIAVVLDDKPGGMNKLVQLLADKNINIENAYGFVLESNKTAVFVVNVSDLEETQKILKEYKFKTMSAEALATIEPFHYLKY